MLSEKLIDILTWKFKIVMEGAGKTPDISMFLIFLRCHPLCAVLIVVLDSESSGSREWQPAVLIVLPAQKTKFLMRQVSIYC